MAIDIPAGEYDETDPIIKEAGLKPGIYEMWEKGSIVVYGEGFPRPPKIDPDDAEVRRMQKRLEEIQASLAEQK